MAEQYVLAQYSFKVKKCYCGTDLSKLSAVPTSNRYGTLPQGKCPKCGKEMLLNAPPVVFEAPATPEPELKVAGVAITPRPAKKARKR